MFKFSGITKISVSFVFLLFIACSGTTNSRLEHALGLAGKNRVELEKVLTHYAANARDTLKYKAACFLIENMPIHYYKKVNAEYYPIMDSLNRSKLSNDSVYSQFDSIKSTIVVSQPTILLDIKTLSSKFLIEHIDKSFENYEKSLWANKIKFSDFCEYILPYNVSNEKREIWTDYYKNKYKHLMTNFLENEYPELITLSDYCDVLNEGMIQSGKIVLYQKGLTEYPPIMNDRIRSGNCYEFAARTTFLMRSLGVPVATDFAPQWHTFKTPHNWNTLLTEKGNFRPFIGFDILLMDWVIPKDFNCPKIFRNTYSIQPASLPQQGFDEPMPGFLNQSNIIDVSAEYFPVTDVTIDILKKENIKSKVVYLCVFNNKDWIPVYWGLVNGHKVTFKNMGKGIVYLPQYYTQNGFLAAGNPFILDLSGKVVPIVQEETVKETLILNRKYHIVKSSNFLKRMLKGSFQFSNDSNFNQIQNIYTIRKRPKMVMNTVVVVNNDKKFRYVRYIGGSQSFTNIAELEFYSKENDQLKKLTGRTIGTVGSFSNPYNVGEKSKHSAFDGDVLTFFDAPADSGCWVGMDLGKKTKIDEIRFLPRNDDNNIRLGDEYELFYWSDGAWSSLGKRKGVSAVLKYSHCPVGALFWLRDHTNGIEERIFMYEKGKQVWW